eukprot:gnl/MRDRNA2_/MRDRNA2_113453_c0_seq1.p1 gnl/MRDRNA2_/MRDRNA2_113453_c0~~gnl/MRDRNA2_/MRDRNA2_113453_c0_seq1.p1  ORF type:complete len:517 (-),score=120.24 gnl/MRDRNA2_/MRDRNA2_113453_c0_seq1:75-1625(-)
MDANATEATVNSAYARREPPTAATDTALEKALPAGLTVENCERVVGEYLNSQLEYFDRAFRASQEEISSLKKERTALTEELAKSKAYCEEVAARRNEPPTCTAPTDEPIGGSTLPSVHDKRLHHAPTAPTKPVHKSQLNDARHNLGRPMGLSSMKTEIQRITITASKMTWEEEEEELNKAFQKKIDNIQRAQEALVAQSEARAQEIFAETNEIKKNIILLEEQTKEKRQAEKARKIKWMHRRAAFVIDAENARRPIQKKLFILKQDLSRLKAALKSDTKERDALREQLSKLQGAQKPGDVEKKEALDKEDREHMAYERQLLHEAKQIRAQRRKEAHKNADLRATTEDWRQASSELKVQITGHRDQGSKWQKGIANITAVLKELRDERASMLRDVEVKLAAGKEEVAQGTATVFSAVELALSVADQLRNLANGPIAKYVSEREAAGFSKAVRDEHCQLQNLLRDLDTVRFGTLHNVSKLPARVDNIMAGHHPYVYHPPEPEAVEKVDLSVFHKVDEE